MMREAELEEMEKKWREENERIMKLHPPSFQETGQPDQMPPVAAPGDPEPDPLPPSERPLP